MVMQAQQDQLFRGTFHDGKIRFSIVQAEQTCNDAILIHDTDPAAGYYFAQALISTLLTVPLMKGNQATVLTWTYEGALKKILCDVTSEAQIRAIPSCVSLVDKVESVADVFGEKGTITVARLDQHDGKILSRGTIQAGLLDVVDDVAYFFCMSDQVETEMIAHVKFNADPKVPVMSARGVMIQAMPEMDLEAFETIRNALRTKETRTALGRLNLSDAHAIQQFFETVAPGEVSLHEGPVPSYRCRCERSQMMASVHAFAKSDLDHIFADRDTVEMECQYCRRKYEIKRSDFGPNTAV